MHASLHLETSPHKSFYSRPYSVPLTNAKLNTISIHFSFSLANSWRLCMIIFSHLPITQTLLRENSQDTSSTKLISLFFNICTFRERCNTSGSIINIVALSCDDIYIAANPTVTLTQQIPMLLFTCEQITYWPMLPECNVIFLLHNLQRCSKLETRLDIIF